MLIANASGVCPLSVRPEASVIVPDSMTGSVFPVRAKASSQANSAALAFSVSNTVSSSSRSAPPSIRPSAASVYAATRSS